MIENLNEGFRGMLEFLKNPQQLSLYMGRLLNIVLILVVAKLSIKAMHSLINRFFNTHKNLKIKVDSPRLETMKGLIKSIVKYVVYFVAFTSIIKAFGTDVTALITAAGVGGLAFGFGAQNLVRDVITGFFILFEDQFSVGSYVEIGGVEGTVEEMTLRVTKIRGFNGDLYIVPNGEIKRVTNKSSGKMRALVEMSIAYEEDIDRAIKVLNQASEELRNKEIRILEGPKVLGVSALGATEVVISVMAKTVPMEQWEVERLMRKSFKEAFDREKIEIPYPKRAPVQKAP